MAKLTLNFPRFKVLCNLARNLAITKKKQILLRYPGRRPGRRPGLRPGHRPGRRPV